MSTYMDVPIGENLGGKVAIVTGAGSRPGEGVGNGRAASILLARAGCKVVCADSVKEWAGDTKKMIEKEGGEAIVVQADVTQPADCEKIVSAAIEKWGRLDVLVNNVGIGGPKGTAETVDLEAWDHGLRVNVTSMMLMMKFAVPEMRKVGGGSIVNIASVAGLLGGHPHLLYPVTKGAVVQLTRVGDFGSTLSFLLSLTRHTLSPGRRSSPRTGQNPRELRMSRNGIHTHGSRRTQHDPRAPRSSSEPLDPQNRRHGMGRWRCCYLFCGRELEMADGGDIAGGCGGDGDDRASWGSFICKVAQCRLLLLQRAK